MADFSDNYIGPDYGAIEKGNFQAISDAVSFLSLTLQNQIAVSAVQLSQKADVPSQDWIATAMALRGRPDSGLVSSNRLITHSIRIHRENTQTISSGVQTKVQWDTADLDNYSEFDSVNYRIIPKVEGLWIMLCAVGVAALNSRADLELIKNGTASGSHLGKGLLTDASASDATVWAFDINTFNGVDDYIEAYITQRNGADTTLNGGNDDTYLILTHLGLPN